MSGQFITSSDVVRERLSWGALAWFSRPAATGGKHLTVIEVELAPGHGHNFHRHPDQEEVLYVIEGEAEQWLEQESRVLRAGDAIFIDKDVVHASFNASGKRTRFLAILGPAASDAGYVSVEVGDQDPWRNLRKK